MSKQPITIDPDDRFRDVVQAAEVAAHLLPDDGTFPNNERLPLLVYAGALRLPAREPAATIEALFQANRWGGSWRNGVYGFQHYHSRAHEVLGIYSGTAKLQLGGEDGLVFTVGTGDVAILPAGTAHKNLAASTDFCCVGAYPPGQYPDMNYGRPGERPRADNNIARVALPPADPVYGDQGPLVEQWIQLQK
jgi:uncharacterized protein YjlB